MFTIRCSIQGVRLKLKIHEESLFVPNFMSWFSAAQMTVVPGETFCDVGLGSGLHAILAAKLGAKLVYGTDINPVALRFARANAKANGVDRNCRFFLGPLVEPLSRRGIKVDAVIYNAPQFPGRLVEKDIPLPLRRSVDGGPGGGDLNAKFIRTVHRILNPHARVYNPIVAWASPAQSLRAIRGADFKAHMIAKIHVPPHGRGNVTRGWFLDHPGKIDLNFRDKEGRDTLARMFELRLDNLSPVAGQKPLRVQVDFRVTHR